MKFNEIMRSVSQANRISQKEIAKITGITESTVSRYFSGEREPSLKSFYKLCILFDLQPSMVLQWIYPDIKKDLSEIMRERIV